jgi:hypothetical protein
VTEELRFHEVAHASGLGARMAHHWLNAGYIDIPRPGSGNPIMLTPAEAAALNDVVGEYLQATEVYGETLRRLHTGQLWAEALQRNSAVSQR